MTLLVLGLGTETAPARAGTPIPLFQDCRPVCLLGEPCTVFVDGEQFNGNCNVLCQCEFEGPNTPTRTEPPVGTPPGSPEPTHTAAPSPSDTETPPPPSGTPTATTEASPTETTTDATATPPATATHTAAPSPAETETAAPPAETPTGTNTATPTETPVPSPSLNPTFAACVGNCDGGPEVTVDELIKGVNIALGVMPLSECPLFDGDGDGEVTISELVRAVSNALYGCGVQPPTLPPTSTRTRTPSSRETLTPTPSLSPSLTATATSTATSTHTNPPQPTPTRTATGTRTSTPTLTPSVTATPLGVDSVCGGFVGSVPQLCQVQVVPNPVPLFGSYRIRFCLADLEGNVTQFCLGVQTSPQPPLMTCQAFAGTGGMINGCADGPPIQSTNPAGTYAVHVQFRDRTGHSSNTAIAQFQIR